MRLTTHLVFSGTDFAANATRSRTLWTDISYPSFYILIQLMETLMNNVQWLDEVKFNEQGLIPAIAQHHQTGRVLMVAWMNREALDLTAEKSGSVFLPFAQ